MRKKVLFILYILFVFILLLIGYLTIHDFQQEKILKNEINELSKMDINKDRYNTTIKTRGDYAVVEKTIKEYLDNYAVSLQRVNQLINDPKLTSLLSFDNYINDGPDFIKSLNYIDASKKTFNTEINKLISSCDEESIIKYIDNKNLNSYYVDFYKKLMLTDNMNKDFRDSRILLEDSKNTFNKLLDNTFEVFSYLISIKGNYEIKDGQIYFKTDDMVNNYNNLINKINK